MLILTCTSNSTGRLQHVRANHVAQGMTVSARLKGLVTLTAADIKECANACDTYINKRVLVKVFKGVVWNEKLGEYIQRFGQRKTDFNFQLSIHTGQGVDRANDKLDSLMSRYVPLRMPHKRHPDTC